MKTREEAAAYGLTFPDSYEDRPCKDQRWQVIRVKPGKKIFLWIYEKDELIHLNVKTDPRWRDFWRAAYPSVIPGYHQNKEHWNTIILDGSVPDKDIERMIGESYDLVTDSPTKRIYEAVKRIPKGHVAMYTSQASLGGLFRHWYKVPCCECERRTCRSICIWRSRCTGRAFERRRCGSSRWKG